MADETLDACLSLSTTKINADIDTIICLLFSYCVVYLFSSRKSLFWVPNNETENFEVKITLESNIALGV